MRPVQVSVDVPHSREDVYDFLDVMANHVQFTDHMLRDWRFDGPPGGVGAKAHATAFMAGRMQAVEADETEPDHGGSDS